MITRAAVKLHIYDTGRDILLPVHRHCDVRIIMAQFGYYRESDYRRDMEGFLTDKDIFLDRCQAADHAYECGQLVESAEEPSIEILFSEDLW